MLLTLSERFSAYFLIRAKYVYGYLIRFFLQFIFNFCRHRIVIMVTLKTIKKRSAFFYKVRIGMHGSQGLLYNVFNHCVTFPVIR